MNCTLVANASQGDHFVKNPENDTHFVAQLSFLEIRIITIACVIALAVATDRNVCQLPYNDGREVEPNSLSSYR